MAAKTPPAGVYVPVPTFFVSRSSPKYVKGNPPLDLEAQAGHAIFLANAGIKGLLLLGSSGEAIALTNQERIDVVRYVRQALEKEGYKNYPLMAGTATQGIEDTVTQLKESKQAGADYGMVLAPGYFAGQASAAGIVAWFEAVADQSPIPVLIYHYPGVSNNIAIPPSAFEKMAQHPNIVGCKLSHVNLSHVAQIALSAQVRENKFLTFTGLGQQLLPVLSVGGAGAIDGLAGFFPHSVVALFDLYRAPGENRDGERWRIMHRLQSDIARGEELIVKYGTIGVKAAVSKVAGFGDQDGTRLPLLGGLTDSQWEEFKDAFDALKEIEGQLSNGTDDAWKL